MDVNKDIGQESVTIYQPASDAFVVNPELGKKLFVAGLVGLGLALVLGLLCLALHMINSRSPSGGAGVSDDNVAVHF